MSITEERRYSREDLPPFVYLVVRMVTSDFNGEFIPDQLLAKETAFETLLFIAA